jgi:hypothetical protein
MAGENSLVAAGAITPGFLLLRNSANKVIPHNIIDVACQKMVAKEKEGESIDVQYVLGEDVFFKLCRPGDVVYMILKDGESVGIGDPCCSNADGKLKKGSWSDGSAIVCVSLDALTASGDTRILTEIF